MATTLQDFGRSREDIPFYNVYEYRMYFAQHQIVPEDVLTWCRNNCEGLYRVSCYTHNTTPTDENGKPVGDKVLYVDRIYLRDEEDARKVAALFDVRNTQILRPDRMKTQRRKRGKLAGQIIRI